MFPGNFEDYLWRKEHAEEEVAPLAEQAAKPAGQAPVQAPKPSAEKRLNLIKLRQMKERRAAIEDEVTRLEVEIADYESALANFCSAEESLRLSELLAARRADLEALLAEWEQVAEMIEASQ